MKPAWWSEKFDSFLSQVSERATYKFEGEELSHQIHKEIIETKWIVIHFYSRLRRLAFIIIFLQMLGLIAVLAALIR